jgi:hypothetical protein
VDDEHGSAAENAEESEREASSEANPEGTI